MFVGIMVTIIIVVWGQQYCVGFQTTILEITCFFEGEGFILHQKLAYVFIYDIPKRDFDGFCGPKLLRNMLFGYLQGYRSTYKGHSSDIVAFGALLHGDKGSCI